MDTHPKTHVMTTRVPPEMVRALDSLAQAEAERLGLPIDRSALVRRALVQALSRATSPELPPTLALHDSPTPTA